MEVEEKNGESIARNKLDILQTKIKEKIMNVGVIAVADIDSRETLKKVKVVQLEKVEYFSLEQNLRKNTNNQGVIAIKSKKVSKGMYEEDRKSAKTRIIEAEEPVKERVLCANRKRTSLLKAQIPTKA